MEHPEEVFARFFPYPSYRRGQLKAIRFLFETFVNGRIGLLSSPCGTGKSVSVLTAYMATRSLGSGMRLMVLTRTRNQLEIYCREAKKVAEVSASRLTVAALTSRKFMCPLASSGELRKIPYRDFLRYCRTLRTGSTGERCPFYEATYTGRRISREALKTLNVLTEIGASTPAEVFKISSREGLCPYEVSKLLLRRADVILGNYNYLFMEKVRDSILGKASIHLDELVCVVDEAHSLPGYLTELTTESISTISLGRAVRECERYGSDMAEYLSRLASSVEELGKAMEAEPDVVKLLKDEQLEETVSDALDVEGQRGIRRFAKALQDEGEAIRAEKIAEGSPPTSYTYRVGLFLEHLVEAEGPSLVKYIEGFTYRGEPHYRVGLRLLDPSPVSAVLNRVYSAVLMSGTLWDTDYYVEVLGLDRRRVGVLEVPYPFPEENRAILVDARVTTRYPKRTEEEWVKIADHIKALRTALKGAMALYFPSYEVMNAVKRHLEGVQTPILYEDEDTSFEKVYSFLKEGGDPMVLAVARGKVSEGVDFSDEMGSLLSAVVIVGVPYPKKTELQEALTKYFMDKFGEKGYEYANVNPCINAIAQAAGRLIRRPEDKGLIILMDSRYLGRIAERLPEDWRRAMKTFRSLKTLVKAVREFQKLWEATS